MTADLPRFAIVGHPNKGKSSIVATLAEDDGVRIAPLPGTTVDARVYPLQVDGETLYELIDTPGFQRPREVLAWLREHERGAPDRPAVLAEFVATARGGARFHDECELLAPILAGAGILYVVDGAHPYGREYEAEMEILRWSGRPRLALINRIGAGDHVAEWRLALGQFFAIVREFDALAADFDKRLDLLRAFGELHEAWAPQLQRAVTVLAAERSRRRQRAAHVITDFLCTALTAVERAPLADPAAQSALGARLASALAARIRRLEHQARRAVQDIYRHGELVLEEREAALFDEDFLTARAAAIFGLSRQQLALTAAASSAAATAGIDLALGGTSVGAFAVLGGVIGGLATLFGADRLAQVRLGDQALGGSELAVGPVSNPQVAWILLQRALLHQRVVAERNHARRGALVVEAEQGLHAARTQDAARRRDLERCFDSLRTRGECDAATRAALRAAVEALLADG